MTRLAPLASLLVVLVTCAAVYSPGLSGPLILDDYVNLEPFLAVDRGERTAFEVVAASEVGPFGRRVALATFALNWLTTGPDVAALKATNLGIHLACGVLVFVLAASLLRIGAETSPGAAHWLALWAAACWLLTPLLVSTVLYTIQRMAQLSALFCLAGLLAYVHGRRTLPDRPATGLTLIGTAALACWPLATLAKENGALLPLLALAVEVFFFRFAGTPRVRQALAAGFVVTLALPATGLLGFLLLDPTWLEQGYSARDFTLTERLLTQPRVLLDYAANALVIGGSPLGVLRDDFPRSTGLLSPPATALAGLAWAAVLIAAWRARAGSLRVAAFGPVFFVAAQAVESTLLPLEIYFEHRSYLPSVGLFIGLAGLAAWSLERVRWRRGLAVVLALVALGYAGLTLDRVLVWRTWEGILAVAEHSHPDSPRVHTGLASLHMNAGDLDRAEAHLDRASELYGKRHRLGVALHRLSAHCLGPGPAPASSYARLDAAQGAPLTVYAANGLDWLAGAAETGGCDGVDLARVARALRAGLAHQAEDSAQRPTWRLRVAAARLFAARGLVADAVTEVDHARRLRPYRLEPGLLAVDWLHRNGDFAQARTRLAALARLDDGRLPSLTRAIETRRRALAP